LLLFQFVRFSVDFAGSRAFVVRGNGGGGCKEASKPPAKIFACCAK